MGAVFQLEDTFTITGRGLVLAGQLVEGVVRVGDRVQLPLGGGDRPARVTGVEIGHSLAADGSARGFLGLLVGELPPAEIPLVRSALAAGQVLHIESATEQPG